MSEDDSPQSWIDAYLARLGVERRYSPRTLQAYAQDLADYSDFLAQSAIRLDRARQQDLRDYLAARHRQGLAPRSLARRLAAVRGLYRFLQDEGRVGANPAEAVRPPKQSRPLPGTLTPEQVQRLLEIDADEPLACRDRAIFELIYSAGIRLAETAALNLADMDLAEGQARVTGKGNKSRLVPIGRFAVDALRDWLVKRAALPNAATNPALFLSRGGARLSRRSIESRLAHWAQRQGLDRHVHPHLLRHSFASHLLESSGDLKAVQELLGHADISTTQVYTHLDFQHLAKVYDAAHPRARRKR